MSPTLLSYKNLAAKVARRKRFVLELIDFTERLFAAVDARRRATLHGTKLRAELNLRAFRFVLGYAALAVDPVSEVFLFRKAEGAKDEILLFAVKWNHSPQDCQVDVFDTGSGWQRSIRDLIKNKEAVFTEVKARRQVGSSDPRRLEQAIQQRLLESQAKRFGLIK